MRLVLSFVPMLLAMGVAPPAFAQDGKRAFDIGEQQRKDRRYEEAQISFDAACREGYAEGCFKLGNSWEHGWGDIGKDPAKSEAAYMRGCNLGQRKSCAGAAITMDDRAETAAQALRYNVAACDEEAISWACSNVGSAYMGGRGTSVNKDQARRYYSTSCDLGSAVGCFWQAKLLEERGTTADLRRAEALYRRHCDDMKGQESCERFATLVFNRSAQESATKTPNASALATAATYLTTSCTRGRKQACREAAQVSALNYKSVRNNKTGEAALRDAARKLVRAYTAAECGVSGCGYNTKWDHLGAKLDLMSSDYTPRRDPCNVLGTISLDGGSSSARSRLQRAATCVGKYYFDEADRMTKYLEGTGIKVTYSREGKRGFKWDCPTRAARSCDDIRSSAQRAFDANEIMRDAFDGHLDRFVSRYKQDIRVQFH